MYRAKLHDGTYRTTTTASGWPDIVAFRGQWILAIELKKDAKLVPDPRQIEWLQRFAAIPTGLAWCSRPTDDLQDLANWIHRPEIAPRIYGWSPPAD